MRSSGRSDSRRNMECRSVEGAAGASTPGRLDHHDCTQCSDKAPQAASKPLLRELEYRGLSRFSVDRMLRGRTTSLFEELESLGVVSGSCFRLPGTGKVSLAMSGTGGAVDSTGTAVPGWVGQFLRHPDREDVLRKLQRSDAAERHAFIFDVLGGAPWPVEYYLNFTEGLDQLPTEAPNLPQPVTGVWIVGQFGQKGLRWTGSAWCRFEARGEGIEGPPS